FPLPRPPTPPLFPYTTLFRSAALSTMSASQASITADGSSTSTITVQLKDASSNNLTAGGDTVRLSTTRGSFPSSCTTDCLATDNGDGTYSLVLTSSTSAGTATISGKLNGSAMSNGTSVAFVPGSATKLVFTSGTASVVSGATKTLTAAVEDANNNVVTSDNSTVVTFAQTAGAGSVTGLGDATASSGVAAVTVTGLNSGSLTVT